MEPKKYQSLGEAIRECRIQSGRSLRDLAKELGIAPSYLSDIENDRRVPAEDVLRKIGEALRIEFDELMALAGRFGDSAERYLKRHPAAGTLFRRVTENNLGDDALKQLVRKAEELAKKEKDKKED